MWDISGILVPQPEVEPVLPPAVEVQSLNL